MLSNLKISQKMLLISILFTIPIWTLLYFYIHRENRTIDFTLREQVGSTYFRPLRGLLIDLQDYKSSSFLYLRGKSSLKAEVLNQQAKLDKDMSGLNALDDRLEMKEALVHFQEVWGKAKSQLAAGKSGDNDKALGAVVSEIRNLFWRVGDKSNLILDPDLDSYYLVDNLVNKVLNNIVYFNQLNDFLLGARPEKFGRFNIDEKTQLFGLVQYIKWGINRMKVSVQTCVENIPDEGSRKEISLSFAKNEKATGSLVENLEKSVFSSNRGFAPRKADFDWIKTASEANLSYWDTNLDLMDNILADRIEGLKSRKWAALISVFFVTAFTYLLVLIMLKSIQNPILLISNRLRDFADGEGDFTKRLKIDGTDEIAELAGSFNTFVGKLKEDSQSQIKYQEEFYKAIIEKTLDGVSIIDAEGKTRYLSPAVERVLGYTIAERMDRSAFELVHSPDIPRVQDLFKRLLANPGATQTIEFQARHKDGSLRILGVNARSHFFNRPDFLGIILNYRDVSGEKKAKATQEMLQIERDQLLSHLQRQMEQMPIALVMNDENFHFTYWNPAAERMFGYSFNEVAGKHPKDVYVPREDWESVDQIFSRLKAGEGKIYGTVNKNIRKDGKTILCEWYNNPILDEEGRFVGRVAMAIDITERRKGEESKSRLVSILEQSTDAIISIGLDGRVLDWNKGAEQVYGYTAGEVVGTHPPFMGRQEHETLIGNLYRESARGGNFLRYENKRVRKDGRQIDIEATTSLIRDDKGQVTSFSAVVRDITDRKKAEETRARLASILEQTRDAVIVSGLDGTILDWNKGAEKLYGYTEEEAKGRTSKFLEPPGRADEINNYRKQLLDGKESLSYETVRRRKDGKLIDVAATFSVLRNEKGETKGFFSIIRDITDRKKAEEIQAEFAATLQQTPDAVIGTDLEGRITSWNRGAERLLGYSFEEINGNPIQSLVPDHLKREQAELRDLISKGESVSNFETTRLRKNGEEFPVSITIFPVKDSSGNIKGVSAIVRDITERKKAEEALQAHMEQLRRAEKMNAIGRLAGGVAHDFNNLLSVVGGNTDFILSESEGDETHLAELKQIKKAVRRGAELTKQLLVFGQKEVVKPQPVNLNETSEEMNKMLKRLIDASIELSIFKEEKLSLIQADLGQMQQVILNLVLNARDAMPQGGKLFIETQNFEKKAPGGPDIPTGSYVLLKVTDSGTGMDPEVQKHIFEPFFTTKGEKGNGLGLAMVYGIVMKWNGHIFVDSTPGQGTVFSLYFPVLKAAPEEAPRTEALTPIPRGSETVLLAEDEEPVRNVLVRSLEKYGYRVLEAPNGAEALQRAKDHPDPIHLLLTDTIMPKMNGKQLADELKKTRPGTKVLFVSGYPQEILSQRGILDPGIQLIQKPFEVEDILRTVRKILDAKEPALPS